MSNSKGSGDHSLDRREVLRLGLRTAGVLCVLPVTSMALVGCGSEPAEQAGTSSEKTPPPAPPRAEPPPAPAPEPPAAAEEVGDRLVTEVPSVAAMVSGLQYVNESAKPDQNCANCQLYTAGSDGRGKCQLFQAGLVKETGWCASWVAKIG